MSKLVLASPVHSFAGVAAIISLLLPVALARPSLGQCQHSANEVGNCGFEVNLDGWTVQSLPPDSIERTEVDFRTGVASLEIDAVFNPTSQVHQVQVQTCLGPAYPGASYNGGLYMKSATSAVPECTVAFIRRDGVCPGSGSFLGATMTLETPLSDEWSLLGAEVPVELETTDTIILATCFLAEDFVIRIDDAFFSTAFFWDGFESGNTSAWNSTQP